MIKNKNAFVFRIKERPRPQDPGSFIKVAKSDAKAKVDTFNVSSGCGVAQFVFQQVFLRSRMKGYGIRLTAS